MGNLTFEPTGVAIKGLHPYMGINGEAQRFIYTEQKAIFSLISDHAVGGSTAPYVVSEHVLSDGSGYRFVTTVEAGEDEEEEPRKVFRLYYFPDALTFPGTVVWEASTEGQPVNYELIYNFPGTPSGWVGNPLFLNASGIPGDPLAGDLLYLLTSSLQASTSKFTVKKGKETLCPDISHIGEFIQIPSLESTDSFHIAGTRQESGTVLRAATSGVGIDGAKVTIFSSTSATTPFFNVQHTSSASPELAVGPLGTTITAPTFKVNTAASTPALTINSSGAVFNKVVSGVTPTADAHLATKKYVDNNTAAAIKVAKLFHYPTTWTQGSSSVVNTCIACSPITGRFVVTGSSSSAAYSDDGINWTAITIAMPVNTNWRCITCSPITGRFVAISYSSSAAYSDDGINWTAITMPSNQNWYNIACSPITGRFVAIVNNNSSIAAYSDDGINWTATTMPSSRNWYDIACSPITGRFVATSSSSIAAYSDDGINWTATTMPSGQNWLGVVCSPITGRFVATGNGSSAAYSDDGINWTAITTAMPVSTNWYDIACSPITGRFVVTSSSSIAAYSDDGINWTATTMPSNQLWRFIACSQITGRFVAISYGNLIYVYSNGI